MHVIPGPCTQTSTIPRLVLGKVRVCKVPRNSRQEVPCRDLLLSLVASQGFCLCIPVLLPQVFQGGVCTFTLSLHLVGLLMLKIDFRLVPVSPSIFVLLKQLLQDFGTSARHHEYNLNRYSQQLHPRNPTCQRQPSGARHPGNCRLIARLGPIRIYYMQGLVIT